ncbi:MAG: PD40 domain-containing protein, partial [Chloroflexi bacterium]|nr:PD40 domain-containing protein [Chloroflexota bacterium]
MPKSRPHLTPEDCLNLKSVSDAQISPDGKLVAYCVADSYKLDSKLPKSQIWIVNSDGAPARQFTSGARADILPRWSPDGAWLAFLSDRAEDGRAEIYLIARRGGEARALTKTQGNVLDLQWSSDSARIAFLMQDPETDEEKKKKETKDDALEFEQHPKYARVWIADVATGAARQVTSGNAHVWEFNWSRDEREFALIVSDSPSEYDWYRARLARVSANGGEPKTIFTPTGNKQLALPRWSPSGEAIAFISCLWSDRGVIAGDLWTLNAKGGDARNLTAGAPRDVSTYAWSNDEKSFVVMGFERGDAAIGLIDVASGTYHRWWISGAPGKLNKDGAVSEPVQAAFMTRWWQQFSLNANGNTIAVAREDPKNPPDVWIAQVQNETLEWKQLTWMNPQT